MNYPKSFQELIDCFKLLPGVGTKTAERYAFSLLNLDEEKTPELVANEKIKKQVKKEDYSELLSMIQKNYPEMFKFDFLNKRLNIYALKHYLGLLETVKEKDIVINALMEIVNKKDLTNEDSTTIK